MRMPYVTGIVFLAVIALANYLGFFNNETPTEIKEAVSIVESKATAPNPTVRGGVAKPAAESKPTISSESPKPAPATVTVQYSDGAFSPKTLEIKVGDKVTFVSQTGERMWVASDPHPSHTIFPDFDQLTPGGTYSFVFTKSGTWHYHNHVSAGAKGTITVK